MRANLFTRSRCHLDAAEETYLDHLKFASHTSGTLFLIALRLFIHGLVPAWFEFGASDRISRLHSMLQKRAQMTRTTSAAHPADARPRLVRSGTE
jgi:hypothetical protein